jgi:hypothetical protein
MSKNEDTDTQTKTIIGDSEQVVFKVPSSEINASKVAVEPMVRASQTIKQYADGLGKLNDICLVSELLDKTKKISAGNMEPVEEMLISQAQTLDSIFNNAAMIAGSLKVPKGNFTIRLLDTFLRLGLKAQSQCRATLETLAIIKNPPHLSFVKQQNVAYQQQVNNGANQTASVESSSRGKQNNNISNKLLEEKDGERLDFGKKTKAGKAHPHLVSVESINRPKNSRRKGKGKSKRA